MWTVCYQAGEPVGLVKLCGSNVGPSVCGAKCLETDGAQPCSTPTGINVAFEDQKHWAGIVILLLLVCSRARAM